MANNLKDDWKKTGKGLGDAFANLGKSIYKSGKHALRHVDRWAEEDCKQGEDDQNTIEGSYTEKR